MNIMETRTNRFQSIATKLETTVEGIFPAAYTPAVQDFLSIYLVPVLNLAVRQVSSSSHRSSSSIFHPQLCLQISPRGVCTELQVCKATTKGPQRLEMAKHSWAICDSCRLLAEAAQGELNRPQVPIIVFLYCY
ncbi:MAG: hypothetical protein AAF245_01455 [Pseudomonadota bacterium]